ncbi:MAG: ATP-binding protein, partial [Rubrivivax sp.]|nr:ATP-binding protein [Rubrivivax sp.]
NIRSVVGELDLDATLSGRDRINTTLLAVLDGATEPWGVKVSRVEIRKIEPPENLIRAMNLQTIHDLRRIVRALRPVYLEELGLAPALEMLVRDLGPNATAAIRFEKTGTPRRLAPEHEMALYRIAQEALTNAWRHSGASQMALTVQFEDDQVTITVRDNGQGFTLPRHPTELGEGERKHFGIMGMHERAALINAHLQIQSAPGSGTTVTVRAPTVTTPDAGLAST